LVEDSAECRIAAKLEKPYVSKYLDIHMHRLVPVIRPSGDSALRALVGRETAISSEAKAVFSAATDVARKAEQSVALFGEKAKALSALAALAMEYAGPGWDGEDAEGIDPIAVYRAEVFLRALPAGVPVPELAPEPDGAISLDWICTRHRVFSLSIDRSDRLAYAWVDGTDSGHGAVRFDGYNIPDQILHGVERTMGLGDAGLRAA
jgi:hypothetical protein